MSSNIISIIIILFCLAALSGIIWLVYRSMGKKVAVCLSAVFLFICLAGSSLLIFIDKFFGNLWAIITFQAHDNPMTAMPFLVATVVFGLALFAFGRRLVRLLNEL